MPTVLPIDLTAIVAVIMGCLIVLVPITGLVARFTLKPIVEAIARMREAQSAGRELELLEKRIALLEQQYESAEHTMARLLEERDFDRKLSTPGS